jgi:hypothetical protein
VDGDVGKSPAVAARYRVDAGNSHDIRVLGCDLEYAVTGTADDERRPSTAEAATLHETSGRR